jgi:enoyl-[acyl-carrier protein] reductase I
MKRNVTTEQVGGSALYLLSDLAAGVTVAVHKVDRGYDVVRMLRTDAAAEAAEMLANFRTQGSG